MQHDSAPDTARSATLAADVDFRAAFALADAGLAVIDGAGTLVQANPALADLLGCSAEELPGKRLREFLHPDDREAEAAAWERLLRDDDSYRLQLRLRHSQGQSVAIELAVTAQRLADGTFGHGVAVLHEVEDWQELETQLVDQGRFRAMADNLPLIVWMHGPDGEQEFVNQTFCDFFGVTREEMREGRWQLFMHPDDADAYKEEFSACVAERRSFKARVRVRNARGEWRHLQSWAQPRFSDRGAYQGHVGASADITDRIEAEAALRRSEMIHRQLAEANLFGVGFGEGDGTISYVNDELLRMVGHTRDDYEAGRVDWQQALAPEYREQADTLMRELRESPRQAAYERAFIMPDGRRTPFVGAAAMIDPLTGFHVSIALDLTKIRQTEEKLRRAKEQLEQRVAERTAELEQQNQRLRRLASQLTDAEHRERQRLSKSLHDGLQQLLVAAKMQLLLMRRRPSEELCDSVERLLGEAISASRSLAYELSPPALHAATVGDALNWLAHWFSGNHHFTVSLDIREDFENCPEATKIFAFTAVRELLLNAVKHSQVDTGTVALMTDASGCLQVTVADGGAGFDPDAWQQQAEGDGGIGLLSLRERARAMGGQLQVDSEPGKGTRVTLTLPLPREAPATSAPAAESTAHPRLRILLADDHEIYREGLAAVLADAENLEIVGHAVDGEDAVRRADELRPDVILMDIHMPRLNGLDAIREIKQRHPEMHIIGLSFHDHEAFFEQLREAGGADYFHKGDDSGRLLAALQALAE